MLKKTYKEQVFYFNFSIFEFFTSKDPFKKRWCGAKDVV
jgi:hypothetical protein